MQNKMRKTWRALTALVLAVALPAAGATMASADDQAPSLVAQGDETTPADAAITKVLRVQPGLALPTDGLTFEFKVAPVSLNGTADASLPTPGNGTVPVTIKTANQGTGEAGFDLYQAQSKKLFSGDLFTGTWPKAGVYVYTVTESASAAHTAPANVIEDFWFSSASYTLTAYVENGTTGLYVKAITAAATTADTGLTGGGKVNPTPGDGEKTFSAFAFTNGYSLVTDPKLPDTPADGYAASVTKMVAGAYADQTRYFEFDVTLNVPAVNLTPGLTYKAYVLNATSGAVETAAANAAANETLGTDGSESYFKFAPGAVKEVKLKHNQRLAFVGLPYTSSLDVSEDGYSDYQASTVITTGNTAAAKTDCTQGAACVAELTGIGPKALDVTYTNTRADGITTPTGLNLDDAAYWAMIALAGSALIAFLVFRVRRSQRAAA
ncbi:MAG: hypothetical protein LBD51_04105 [Bifidobacteriaceae bacterium]|jgi:hypothetical protein|nr:hypothetical protein [Bifidobacteriaceae bacterium]